MNKFPQKSVSGKVYTEIIKYELISAGDKIVVAVSGGADSICLLFVLLGLREKLKITVSVCHFNHRLRGEESDKDEEFVRELCTKQGIECVVGRAPKANSYKSEDEARAARYSFFEKLLAGESIAKIAIAHNQNDQAETVLLRLIRGSGFCGLKAIPRVREKFIRPLLTISRLEIEEYLRRRHLSYRTDSSNTNLTYLRNQIRRQILPEFAKINPNISETLANSTKIIEDDVDYLNAAAHRKFTELAQKNSSGSIFFDRKAWLKLHPSMKRLVLRLALNRVSSLLDITLDQIDGAIAMIDTGRGKKWKPLPHSLRISLIDGKIKVEKLKLGNKK